MALGPLLQLPFSVELMGTVEGVGEWAGSRGRLQLTLQLGSRNTAFSERLDVAGSEHALPPERRRSAAPAGLPVSIARHARSLPSPLPPRLPSPPTRLQPYADDAEPPPSPPKSSFRPSYEASSPPPPPDRFPPTVRRSPCGSPPRATSASQTDLDNRPLPPPPPPPQSPQHRPDQSHNATFTFGLSKTLDPHEPPAATSSPIKSGHLHIYFFCLKIFFDRQTDQVPLNYRAWEYGLLRKWEFDADGFHDEANRPLWSKHHSRQGRRVLLPCQLSDVEWKLAL